MLLVGYTLNKAWTFAAVRRAVHVAERAAGVSGDLGRAEDHAPTPATESPEP